MNLIQTRIVPYNPTEHFAAIFEIEERCFQADAFSRETFIYLYRMGKDTFLVALQQETVVGYISAYVAAREGYIASIAVSPDVQRQGVGRQLLEAVLAVFRQKGLARVRLHVRVSNQSAIALYQQFNFTTVRTIPRYYGDGENGLEMVLRL